jgi:branched-chain amino acid aminotransferase
MSYAFVNGQFVASDYATIGIQDMAIQRGYGIFDFFKVMKGMPVFLEDHLARFYGSAAELRLNISVSKDDLVGYIHELISRNNWQEAGIRITLTGGYAPDGYSVYEPNLIMAGQPIQLPTEVSETGLKLLSHEHIRQLPKVKSIDYLMAVWMQDKVKAAGADELIYHQNGWISECPRANVFIVTADGTLATPREGALFGITRKKVLELAGKLFKAEERPVHLSELETATEAFVTSTTKIVHPIFEVDGKQIGEGLTGPVTRKLFEAYDKLLPA